MRLLLILSFVLLQTTAVCQVYVDGYSRADGTWVEPHYRSSPDGDPYNNYSYPGNYNPYTGKIAGGKEETYLANYYQKFAYTTKPSNKIAYDNALLEYNYWKKLKPKNSMILDTEKKPIAFYKQDPIQQNKLLIFSLDSAFFGTVTFKETKYVVRDCTGMKLYSVSKDGRVLTDNTGQIIYTVLGGSILIAALLLALAI